MLKHSTLARLNGYVVVIVEYGELFSRVRYAGHKGKQLCRDVFTVATADLDVY